MPLFCSRRIKRAWASGLIGTSSGLRSAAILMKYRPSTRPRSSLRGVPMWMSWLSRIDPVTYGVDSLRQQSLKGSLPGGLLSALALHPIATDVTIMFVLAIAFIVPAVWQFGRQE